MLESYKEAEAIITIEGRTYALFKRGPLKEHPYMVDTITGEIPHWEQRSLLKQYLLQRGADTKTWEGKATHWFVRQAIKAAREGGGEGKKISVPAAKTAGLISKEYLPLTVENIAEVYQQVLEDLGYSANFSLIREVLNRFPENTDKELVAMKIALIDLTNSTHIGTHISKISLSGLTEVILRIQDFDERLAQGDPELVNQLARSNGRINLFSFASKYCTYHNAEVYGRDDYSIFDRIVQETLPHYVSGLTKARIGKWRTHYHYAAFSRCIEDLLDESGIHIPFRRRKLDYFLWYANRKRKTDG